MFYVYRHIRLDKNCVFYIGVGTVMERSRVEKWRYERAYSTEGRNKHWKRVYNKTAIETAALAVAALEAFDRNQGLLPKRHYDR